jgi:hypothetical protein
MVSTGFDILFSVYHQTPSGEIGATPSPVRRDLSETGEIPPQNARKTFIIFPCLFAGRGAGFSPTAMSFCTSGEKGGFDMEIGKDRSGSA